MQLGEQDGTDPTAASNPTTHRPGAPATATVVSASTAITRAMPSAGSARISSIGTPARTSASATSRLPGPGSCRDPLASTAAIITITASLANAEGSSCTGPRANQARAPLTTVPAGESTTSSAAQTAA